MKSRFDGLFRLYEERYGIHSQLLKALARHESRTPQHPEGWDPMAYRYEPVFWKRYMEGRPEWAGKDPKRVSASYGLCQLMYSTAVELGYEGDPEGLYDPEVNIALGAKLLKRLLDEAREIIYADVERYEGISVVDVALARYNGGRYENPCSDRETIRNKAYADTVNAEWMKLKSEGGYDA